MKQNKLKNIRAIILVLAIIFSTNIYATTTTVSKNGYKQEKKTCKKCKRKHSGNCGGGHQSVPLDGGLGILVLGAAAFGIKKLNEKKENN